MTVALALKSQKYSPHINNKVGKNQMRTNEKWYDSDDPERIIRGGAWYASKWMILVAAIVVALSLGGWAFSVVISNAKGTGDAVILKNGALNRTQAQAQFNSGFQSIKSLDQKLSDAQVQLDAFNKTHPSVGNGTPFDPTSEQQANLMRTVTGLQQQCRNAVADYNASTRTYTLQDFRDTDLPREIGADDPAFTAGVNRFSDFDCQANA